MADTTISSIFAELSKLDEDTFPPVENWDPPLCENVHMKIDRNGKWFFMDSVISRERMVKLFSRVLRLDGEEYFLVTPVEKIKIEVEDKPFTIVDFEFSGEGNEQIITFRTNTDEIFEVNSDHPIRVATLGVNDEPSPYALVRKNLEGLISRNVYYKLIDMAEEVNGFYGIYSSGNFFRLN